MIRTVGSLSTASWLSVLPIMRTVLLIGDVLCCIMGRKRHTVCPKLPWEKWTRPKAPWPILWSILSPRNFFQGRNVSRALGWRWPPPPQAASSPPQGPNTLHIYIGAPANTVHLLQKVFSWNKTLLSPRDCPWLIRNGNIILLSLPSSPLLVMRAVLPESHYWQKGKRKIPQLEQLAEHYPCLRLHTLVNTLTADNSYWRNDKLCLAYFMRHLTFDGPI